MTIRDLLRNALRMRPDRIVIGEVRGAEALDLLTALNTGHDGALSTVHANSPEDALRRLETLALMAGVGLPARGDPRAARARRRPGRPPGAARRRRAAGGRGRRGRPGAGRGRGARAAGGRGDERRRERCRILAARRSPAAWRRWRSARRCSPRPAAARWLAAAVEPLRRAGREGYAPTELERRRLAVVGTGGDRSRRP